MTDGAPEVLAAGGLVERRSSVGAEVALVHRPKYDDWTIPKGKLHVGEHLVECAVREVQEETGLHCRLEATLPEVRYVDRKGRSKHVWYWRMRPIGHEEFRANGEVDEVRWMSHREAVRLLTHDRDREVLEAAERRRTLVVVRHAKAGDRDKWRAPDDERPLTSAGARQAAALVELLDAVPAARFVSSPYVRCMQTLEPLAASRGTKVEADDRLAEGRPMHGLLELAELGLPVVVCTHGDLCDELIHWAARHRIDAGRGSASKGSTLVLDLDGEIPVSLCYQPPPPV